MKTFGPREVKASQIDAVAEYFVQYFKVCQASNACYMYAMGGQPKKTYLDLSRLQGVSLRLMFNCLPTWLGILRFIPSYAAVVQITDSLHFPEVIEALSDSGIVGIYIFDRARDADFISLIAQKPHKQLVDNWRSTVDEGLFYELDSTNPASASGMYDWLTLGSALPSSVRDDLESLWNETLSSG